MSWLLIASIPPLLWSISNVLDEYLAKHHFAANGVMYIIMASVLELLVGGVLIILNPFVLQVPLPDILFLGGLGVLLSVSFIPYVYALQGDGAALAVPIFQLEVVWVFLLGWLFLGEGVTVQGLLACTVIVVAAIGIGWDFKTRKIAVRTLLLMLLSTIGLSTYTVSIRHHAMTYDWLSIYAWVVTGAGIAACLALCVYKPWRDQAVEILQRSGKKVSTIFVMQSGFDMAANATLALALTLAPAAGFVQTMNGLQPFYVFIFALILGRFFPHLYEHIKIDAVFFWRLFCIIVLFAGVGWLSSL